MIKSIIVAKSENHVIGQGERLPWKLPKDLQHFRRITMGHHVIMGRKTFATIHQPLVGRKVIVVTRDLHYRAAGCTVVHDIHTAFAVAEQAKALEVFVAGGAMIYQATLTQVDKIYLTTIKTTLTGDAFFPELDMKAWKEVKRIRHTADAQHLYAYDFVELISTSRSQDHRGATTASDC